MGDGMYDLTLDRVQAAAFASRHGWDEFMKALEGKAGRELQLYSVSTVWTRDASVTVLKARGAKGDLLVRLS